MDTTIAQKDRVLSPEKEAVLFQTLSSIYPPDYLDRPGSREVFEVEIHTRPYWFRKRYLPWIESVTNLEGKKILEIGAGTGTSAIPFAERGAHIRSIDINHDALKVARVRAQLHGLTDLTDFQIGNAAEIESQFDGSKFDIIVYFAALEHMTYPERIKTLRSAWALLKPGGFLIAVDTPNRLWYYDNHTSFANFFHWLPTEVAIDYAKYTTRAGFNAEFNAADPNADVRMSRWGRGVSFHEFEIALGPIADLETSGEWAYRRLMQPDWAAWWAETRDGQYHEFLKTVCPQLPSHWLEEEIAISLQKPI